MNLKFDKYTDIILDRFYDIMKSISDKYNLGLEDGFSISREGEEVFVHYSFTSNISIKISTARLIPLALNDPKYIDIEESILTEENAFIQTCDEFISINADCHLFILVDDTIGDAPIDIIFAGCSGEGGRIYVNKFRQSDILDMKCIGLKFVFNKTRYIKENNGKIDMQLTKDCRHMMNNHK